MTAMATTTATNPILSGDLVNNSRPSTPSDFTHDENSESTPRGRLENSRPVLTTRRTSGTMIIPTDQPDKGDTPLHEYPPDDARAMSPRRSSEETERLGENTRLAVYEHARQSQLSLLEIAESIELVKADHDKLEKQNLALQDYIGGLTRSMSKNELGSGKKSRSKK